MKGLTFVPEMAIAVMAGRKTVTRRVIVPQPQPNFLGDLIRGFHFLENGRWASFDDHGRADGGTEWRCDYTAGERRCLLTTWAFGASFDRMKPTELDETFRWWHAGQGLKPDWCGKSRPGRFLPNHLRPMMPVFEIVSVRAERVQDITEDDAKAEGCTADKWTFPCSLHPNVTAFSVLWNSINNDRGYGWDANPWVWRVEFKRVSP